MNHIHINCDLGEGGSRDAELMPLISACNIACGGHAGTVESIHDTVALAMKYNVQMGAHPSYPDKENFGRFSLEMEPEDLKQTLVAQILSLKQIAEAEGGFLSHVKPHGALYNDAAKDEKTAQIIIDSVLEFDENWPLYVPENSVISRVAKGQIGVIFEAFADRNYQQNYQLVSRSKSNALITEKEEVFNHLFSMFFNKEITCENDKKIACDAATFCVHGDTPNLVEILQYLREKFKEKDVEIWKAP
ncbi:5-oxoprolinase subunit PxpA [Antarcticibacterium arcticum]|uniref:5-oxoprolinase subunit PxpA n=1 Tax=Antarcticibacterium arcticum TaxID=2585771 RepID=A0A5B8YHY4_9FLAO|nr:5-oxoprolinase subunit PxpA [Antarcticibacterium arcticum]QED36447.1 5-oxoprolinase subunit PxpA [Antarcticibacterium arcticum]